MQFFLLLLHQINFVSSWINIQHNHHLLPLNNINTKINVKNKSSSLNCSNNRCNCYSKTLYHPKENTPQNNLLSARDARVLTPLKGLCLSELFLNVVKPSYAIAVEGRKENPIKTYFDTSTTISNIGLALRKVLPNFTRGNTLLCTSLCSDEVNADFIDVLSNNYGQNFNLAGLGGVPFVGWSGMGAAVSHIPDQGNILIVVGSHVGYSPAKELLGKVKRRGRQKLSGACGAAIGALAQVKEGAPEKESIEDSPKKDIIDQIQDIQEDYIIEQLLASPNKPKDFSDEENAIAWVTYEVLKIAQDTLKDILDPIVLSPSFSTANLVVLGGVLINKGEEGEDLFQPVTFEVSGVDLFDDFQKSIKKVKAEAVDAMLP